MSPQQRVFHASRKAAFALSVVSACLAGSTLGTGCCSMTDAGGAGNAELGAFDPASPNPLFVKTQDATALWDAIVDVIDNYYVIEVESPVRTYEQTGKDGATYEYRTEGRIDTKPSIVGGAFDPWRKNSAPCGEKLFATLQTARSSATVRVVPEGSGFFIYVSVYEEIEDLPHPMGSHVIADTQFNEDLTKIRQAVGERQRSKGWIPVGHNTEQENRILREIGWRVGVSRSTLHTGVDYDLTP